MTEPKRVAEWLELLGFNKSVDAMHGRYWSHPNGTDIIEEQATFFYRAAHASEAQGYAKGYATGQVKLLQGLKETLHDDEDIRTVVAAANLIDNLLEDKTQERNKLYGHK